MRGNKKTKTDFIHATSTSNVCESRETIFLLSHYHRYPTARRLKNDLRLKFDIVLYVKGKFNAIKRKINES